MRLKSKITSLEKRINAISPDKNFGIVVCHKDDIELIQRYQGRDGLLLVLQYSESDLLILEQQMEEEGKKTMKEKIMIKEQEVQEQKREKGLSLDGEGNFKWRLF